MCCSVYVCARPCVCLLVCAETDPILARFKHNSSYNAVLKHVIRNTHDLACQTFAQTRMFRQQQTTTAKMSCSLYQQRLEQSTQCHSNIYI